MYFLFIAYTLVLFDNLGSSKIINSGTQAAVFLNQLSPSLWRTLTASKDLARTVSKSHVLSTFRRKGGNKQFRSFI